MRRRASRTLGSPDQRAEHIAVHHLVDLDEVNSLALQVRDILEGSLNVAVADSDFGIRSAVVDNILPVSGGPLRINPPGATASFARMHSRYGQ